MFQIPTLEQGKFAQFNPIQAGEGEGELAPHLVLYDFSSQSKKQRNKYKKAPKKLLNVVIVTPSPIKK